MQAFGAFLMNPVRAYFHKAILDSRSIHFSQIVIDGQRIRCSMCGFVFHIINHNFYGRQQTYFVTCFLEQLVQKRSNGCFSVGSGNAY